MTFHDLDSTGQHERHLHGLKGFHAVPLKLGVIIHVVRVETVVLRVSQRQQAGVVQVLVVAGNPISDVLAGRGLRGIG